MIFIEQCLSFMYVNLLFKELYTTVLFNKSNYDSKNLKTTVTLELNPSLILLTSKV